MPIGDPRDEFFYLTLTFMIDSYIITRLTVKRFLLLTIQHMRHLCMISMCTTMNILLDYLLTVKAATLTFISGCGLAISSAKEGKSGSTYNLVKS